MAYTLEKCGVIGCLTKDIQNMHLEILYVSQEEETVYVHKICELTKDFYEENVKELENRYFCL